MRGWRLAFPKLDGVAAVRRNARCIAEYAATTLRADSSKDAVVKAPTAADAADVAAQDERRGRAALAVHTPS